MSTPAEVAAQALRMADLQAAEARVATADAAVDAATNPQVVAPTEVAPDPSVVPGKTRGDLMRDSIYARADANRLRPGDESEEAMREGVRQLGSPEDGQPMEPVVVTNPQAVTPQTSQQPPANDVGAPLANQSDMVTIRVEGREIAVSAARVHEAGIATLQKETAADIRLQRVSLAEQALALERADLDRRAAEIESSRTTTQQGAVQPNDQGAPPDTGANPQVVGVKQVLDALLDSDTDAAGKALEQVIADRVQRIVGKAQPTAQPTNPQAVATVPSPWSKQEVERVNGVFAVAFKDIMADPAAKEAATARIVHEMANPVNRMGKVDLMQLAAMVGEEVRQSFSSTRPVAQPPANIADELAARRSLAARIPGVTTSGAPRAVPTAPTQPARPSGSDIVAGMRKARGQE